MKYNEYLSILDDIKIRDFKSWIDVEISFKAAIDTINDPNAENSWKLAGYAKFLTKVAVSCEC